MKPFRLIPLLLRVLPTWTLLLAGFRSTAQVVEIPDPVVEEAIRRSLGKEEGELTRFDLSRLINVYGGFNPVTNLEGLQHATNIEYLVFQYGNLGSVEIPETWPNLKYLTLTDSAITNITLPRSMPQLETLELQGNEIGALTIPTNAPLLRSINIARNEFTELEIDPNFRSLREIHLAGNALRRLEIPPHIRAGLELLTLSSLAWTSNFTLNDFHQLKHLKIEEAGLTSLKLPPTLTGLNTLSLRGNQLKEVHIPAEIRQFQSLDLIGNPLTNLTLPGRPKLNELGLTLTEIVDSRFLRDLPQPHNATLELGPNTDQGFLMGWTDLRSLVIRGRDLKQLQLPSKMNQLTFFSMTGTQVTNLSFIEGKSSLRDLHLQNNNLTRLDLPSGLSSLASVDVSDNLVTSISAAEEIPSCRMLFFFNNGVNSLTIMPEFTRLDLLATMDSPLSQLILPETLATNYLATLVEELREAMAEVYTYPVNARLEYLQQGESGGYDFWIKGPPGIYTTESTTNLTSATWTGVGRWTNTVGEFHFYDAPREGGQRYYRVHRTKP